MAFSPNRILFVFSLFLSYGFVEFIEASHHVHASIQHHLSTTLQKGQPYRSAVHFQPAKNWMNDPNGPMLYKGIYHLFYQYNPKGAVWGNIVWAHSTSTDLVNWAPHEIAIHPSQPSDVKGCWSGSTTILPGNKGRDNAKPAILYTGINSQEQQVQNLAFPRNLSDPYLRKWTKSRLNPVMAPTAANRINASSFRDTTTAWLGPDGTWRVIIGSKQRRRGMAILYRTTKGKNFEYWTKLQRPLHSADGTGMWECPDFFPVHINGTTGVETSVTGRCVKHVLKVSLADTKHDHYTIGSYDYDKDIYIPDKGSVEGELGLRYDYGKFYASKTFFDSAKNRRVLWGWVNESSSEEDDWKKGWSGVQAIPRSIWLDESGKQLIQWPVKEIESLRSNQINLIEILLKTGSVLEISGVTAAQADVEVLFDIKRFDKTEEMDPSWTDPQVLCDQKGASVEGGLGPFGILVLASECFTEYTAVFFRIFKAQNKYTLLMCSDQSRSSLNEDNDKTTYGAFVDVDPTREKVSLRTMIDHFIVQSFGGEGETCITPRVYPTLAIYDGAHLYAFNNGSQSVVVSRLSAWSMKQAQIN